MVFRVDFCGIQYSAKHRCSILNCCGEIVIFIYKFFKLVAKSSSVIFKHSKFRVQLGLEWATASSCQTNF